MLSFTHKAVFLLLKSEKDIVPTPNSTRLLLPSVLTLDGDITPMAWCHAACYHAPLAWRHAKTAVEMEMTPDGQKFLPFRLRFTGR